MAGDRQKMVGDPDPRSRPLRAVQLPYPCRGDPFFEQVLLPQVFHRSHIHSVCSENRTPDKNPFCTYNELPCWRNLPNWQYIWQLFFPDCQIFFPKAIVVSVSAWLGPYSTGFAGCETKNWMLQLISQGPTTSHLTEPPRNHSTHRCHCASSKTNPQRIKSNRCK